MADITFYAKDIRQKLRSAGIDSYGLDTDLLIAAAVAKAREFVICHTEYMLSDVEEAQLLSFVARRVAREPISQILGYKEFWGRDFTVSCHTLTPRPDSETLIDTVLRYYPDTTKPLKILDLGTGTGCLIITLLCEYPQAIGEAVEACARASEIACTNAENLGVSKRLSIHKCRWEEVVFSQKFDIIISNPPYIPIGDKEDLAKDVAEFEPDEALFAGQDGLNCYRALLPLIPSWLDETGIVVMEHGIDQEEAIAKIAVDCVFDVVEHAKDLAGIHRCIVLKK
jgi:release factor glutamine methyltransferase